MQNKQNFPNKTPKPSSLASHVTKSDSRPCASTLPTGMKEEFSADDQTQEDINNYTKS